MTRLNIQSIAESKNWTFSTLENVYDFQYGQFNINPDNGGIYQDLYKILIMAEFIQFMAQMALLVDIQSIMRNVQLLLGIWVKMQELFCGKMADIL